MKLIEYGDKSRPVYDIICIGAGATGSHFISFFTQLLSNNAEHTLTIVDQDIIENKNLINQKFLPRDVGKNKAQALSERYGKVYPNIKIAYRDKYVKTFSDIEHIVKNRLNVHEHSIPIILGCVDNNPSRVILSDYFNKYRDAIAYIDAGNGDELRVGQIIIAAKSVFQNAITDNYYRRDLKVLAEPVADIFKDIREDKTDINKILSCTYVSQDKPQNIGTNIMSATALYSVINNLISFDELPCTRINFDAENCNMVSRTVLYKEKEDEKKVS